MPSSRSVSRNLKVGKGQPLKMPRARFEIRPEKTALLVIDMQRGFLREGSPMLRPCGRDLIPGLNRLIEVCHRYGVRVFFTRHAFRSDLSDVGIYPEFLPGPPERYMFLEGKPDAEIAPEMQVGADDIIVTKNAYSAFAGTDLATMLNTEGIDTLIIGGVDVHVCCEATARDARHRNRRVIFLADGTATRDQPDAGWGVISADEMQRNVLTRMSLGYAEVATIEDVIARLETEQK